MKRILSVFLVLCTVFGLMMPLASAATSTDLEMLQKAVVETALAYYYKGSTVQYDSYYIGHGNRYQSVILRQTNYRSPEDSSVDDIHYTVCSAYPWDVYYNVFQDRLIGAEEKALIEPLVGEKDNYNKNFDGMKYTEDQLADEYAKLGVVHSYVVLCKALQNEKDDSGVSVGYWGPDAWDADGKVIHTTCWDTTGEALLELLQPGDILNALTGKFVPAGTTSEDDGGDDELVDDDAATDTTTEEPAYDENGNLTNGYYKQVGGHAMMYLGDIFGDGVNYVIHSMGAKYNDNNNADSVYKDENGNQIHGFDRLEDPYSWKHPAGNKAHYYGRNGSIVLTPYDEIIAGGTYNISECNEFSVLRPLAAKTVSDLTPAAQFRLHHPGMTVTKTASVKPYNDVKAGDEITYTIKLENNTTDAVNAVYVGTGNGAVPTYTTAMTYNDLKITETLPAGTELKAGSSLTETVTSLAPGATAEFSYTVVVTATSGQIVSSQGRVESTTSGQNGYLSTKELTHEVVADHFTADIYPTVNVNASTAAPRSGMDVAEDVYAALGYELELPDGQELVNMITKDVTFPGEQAARNMTDFQLVDSSDLTGTAKTLRDMVVPGFVGGGRLLTTDENNVRTNENRLRTLDEGFFQPGDILVYLNAKTSRATDIVSEDAYVYLGSSYWAHYKDGEFIKKSYPVKTYYGNTGVKGILMDSDLGSHYTNALSGAKKYAYNETFYPCFLQDLFFVLRPSRVGLTAVTAATTAKAVEIDGTYYADLASAVTDADDGDTIVLHEDLALSGNYKINGKNITLDLGGHTIRCTTDKKYTLIADDNDTKTTVITIQNGTVEGMLACNSGTTLHLKDMTLLGREQPEGTDAVYSRALNIAGSAKKMTLENVTIASAYAADAPFSFSGSTAVDFSNVTIVDDVKVLVPSTVTWEPANLNTAEDVTMYTSHATRSFDGTIRGDLADVAYTCYTYTTTGDVYNVTRKTNHPSLTHAMNEAQDGDTLRLLRDIDAQDLDEVAMDYDGTSGKVKYFVRRDAAALTLEMNGKTISNYLASSGCLYFRGSGTPKITIKNGTIKSVGAAITSRRVELEDLKVHSSRIALAIPTGAAGTNSTIRGSQLVSGVSFYGGAATIPSSSGSAVVCKSGTLTIQDSVVVSNGGTALEVGEGSSAGKILLENTRILAHMYTYNVVGTKKLVNGTVDPADGYKLTASRQASSFNYEGKALSLLEDTYAVDTASALASINGTYYASVERALEEVKENETVTLAKNTTVSGEIAVPADVTLDTGDYRLTLAEGATLTVAGTVTGSVDDTDASVILEGKGSYLGITIPEFVTAETVYADQKLDGEYTITAGSTLQLSGTCGADHSAIQVWKGSENTELNGKSFVIGNVAAKDMNDEIDVTLVAGDSTAAYVGKTETICIRSCVEGLLAEATDSSVKKALVSLLNYGAAAQTYFDKATTDLANANIGDYQTYAVTEDELAAARVDTASRVDADNIIRGTSCVLGQDLRLKLYFAIPDGAENLSVQVKYGTTEKTVSVDNGLTNANANYYYLKLDDLTLKDFGTDVTITVYNGTTEVASATDSIQSYLARFHEMDADMSNAILAYALAVSQLS